MHWIATSFTECISVDYPNIIISQPINIAISQFYIAIALYKSV